MSSPASLRRQGVYEPSRVEPPHARIGSRGGREVARGDASRSSAHRRPQMPVVGGATRLIVDRRFHMDASPWPSDDLATHAVWELSRRPAAGSRCGLVPQVLKVNPPLKARVAVWTVKRTTLEEFIVSVRISGAPIAVCAVGVILGACSGASAPAAVTVTAVTTQTLSTTVTVTSTPSSTTTPTSRNTGSNGVGKPVTNGGATVTVTSLQEASTVKLDGRDAPAGDDAKYVLIATLVNNGAKESMDLTCGYPIANKLVDTQNRQFDAIEGLYKVSGNPGCNKALQPGFKEPMTWIYKLPKEAVVLGWAFGDATDINNLRPLTLVPLQFS